MYYSPSSHIPRGSALVCLLLIVCVIARMLAVLFFLIFVWCWLRFGRRPSVSYTVTVRIVLRFGSASASRPPVSLCLSCALARRYLRWHPPFFLSE